LLHLAGSQQMLKSSYKAKDDAIISIPPFVEGVADVVVEIKGTPEGNSDIPAPDLRTMEELCQPSLNGRGRPITPIAIQATNFGLKNDMIQQV
nr:reverse transcriptase domain-containing protein [Tanacetum cinerariifolium]